MSFSTLGIPVPVTADLATRYVAVSGSDSASGLTPESAKATIQAAHDALPATGGEIRLGAGTWTRVGTRQATITKAVRFLGAGMDLTTLVGGVDSDYQFYKGGTTTITGIEFCDMTLDMQSGTSRAGIGVNYVNKFAVRRCRFKNVTQWGIVAGVENGLDSVIRNTGIIIEDCEFDTIAGTYEQVLLLNSRDIKVRNCGFLNISSSSIGLGLYQNLDNVTVSGCLFSGPGFASYYSLSCNGITYDDCTFKSGHGIQGANEPDNGTFGFTVVKNLKVTDCTFATVGESYGLQLGAAWDPKVIGCTFERCRRQGINITAGNAATIAKVSSRNIKILGCTFRENNQAGDLFAIQPAIMVSMAANSPDLGLLIAGCTFEDNQATQTQVYPIGFFGAFSYDKATIVGNKIKAGTAGFSVVLQGGATLGTRVVIYNNLDYSGAGLGGVVENIRLGDTGAQLGFYGTAPIAKQAGVAVTAAGIHAALVALGLLS